MASPCQPWEWDLAGTFLRGMQQSREMEEGKACGPFQPAAYSWKGVTTRALRPQPLYLALSTAVTVPFLSHHTLQCHLPFSCTLVPLAPEFLLPSGGPHVYFAQQAASPGHRVLLAPGRAVCLPRNSFHVIDFHANISGPQQALLLWGAFHNQMTSDCSALNNLFWQWALLMLEAPGKAGGPTDARNRQVNTCLKELAL